MAYLTFHNDTKEIRDQQEVLEFLNGVGVIYEQWDITKLPERLQDKFNLSDDEKNEILNVFKDEIADLSARRGYHAQDIVSLSDLTPNLDQLLENFKREHHHTDDEVRFIVSGHGIFAIEGENEEWFDVHLTPGDLISVPVNVRHYFELEADRKVVAVRIFVTTEGWVPIYEKEEVEA